MEYSIFLLLVTIVFLGLIFFFILKGKPSKIQLEIEGFLDSYESIDFKNEGRVVRSYKAWINKRASLLCNVEILFSGYLMNWGRVKPLNIELSIVDEIIPKGFEIELKKINGAEVFVPGYIMKLDYWGKKGYQLPVQIVLKQIENDIVLKDPLLIKFGIKCSYHIKRFLFFSASNIAKVNYDFFIGPDLDNTWIAFDPGTSGSCVAAGNALTEVVVEIEDEEEKVTPSVLTFNKTIKPDDFRDQNGKVRKELYQFGVKAVAEMALKKNVTFQSIKKLLGFTDKKSITYENGKEFRVDGSTLSSLLVKGIYDDFKSYVEQKPELYKSIFNKKGLFSPQRAVVAIPNNFTAPKIIDMLKCLDYLDQFKEVRYISEAEAVLCYYIYQHDVLNPNSKNGLIDETVLIFDMGGATINTTIADVTMMDKKGFKYYDIDIDSKIGYGIGGDTIDYCLAKSIFLYKDDHPALAYNDPFSNGINDTVNNAEQYRLKRDIQLGMFELKKNIIERYYHKPIIMNDNNEEFDYGDASDMESVVEKTIESKGGFKVLVTNYELSEILTKMLGGVEVKVELESPLFQLFRENSRGNFPIFQTPFFQKYVYQPIQESVNDVINLSYREGAYIDTVLFSGRSCMFPLIKENVKRVLKKVTKPGVYEEIINPLQIVLSDKELKTAVVKGACWYGIHSNAVKLSPLKVNSTFGVVKKSAASKNSIKFHELITIGEKFQKDKEGAYVEGTLKISDYFQFDSQHVHFYQIMGKDALKIIKKNEKHKYSRITSIEIEHRSKEIGTTVTTADKVECTVWTANGECITHKNIDIDQEITDANEEHYTWIVN